MGIYTPDEVLALAPDKRSQSDARKQSQRDAWRRLGRDGEAVWGIALGSKGDAYAVYVTAGGVAALRCSCPSRKRPCKHALGLALLEASAPDPAEIAQEALPAGHRYSR